MNPSTSDTNLTIGQLLVHLRQIYKPDNAALAKAVQASYTTYRNIERGKRELSFLMALRICKFYQLDLHEFISMLGDQELERKDQSVFKASERIERKKADAYKSKGGDLKTEQNIPEERP